MQQGNLARSVAENYGQGVVPAEASSAPQRDEAPYHESFAALSAELEVQDRVILELREQNADLRAQNAALRQQLPDDNAVKQAQQSAVDCEVTYLLGQMSGAHDALVTMYEAMTTLFAKVMDGVPVVVSEQNVHGQLIKEAMGAVERYTDSLPEPAH